MRYIVKGADAKSGIDREETIEARDEATALGIAKERGIFVSKITAAPEPEPEIAPMSQLLDYSARRRDTPPPTMPAPDPDAWESPRIAMVLDGLGMLEIFGAVIVAFFVGASSNAAMGALIAVVGVVSGLMMLGLSAVIDHVSKCAHRLRKIETLLRNK